MLNQTTELDRVFRALADPSRRRIVEHLSHGPATVSEVARPLDMSLSAVLQHLQVLETCGVLRSEKVGRVRICHVEPASLHRVEQWIARHPGRLGGPLRPARRGARPETRPARATEGTRMNRRSVTHTTFTIERTYDADPARVFQAFADPAVKHRWFVGPEDWEHREHEIDFRVGGREINRGGPAGGPVHTYQARFWDIVPPERIVYTYDMHMDDIRTSVSLATVQLQPAGTGTHLTYTEQGAFLDGYDSVEARRHGTGTLLDLLSAELTRG